MGSVLVNEFWAVGACYIVYKMTKTAAAAPEGASVKLPSVPEVLLKRRNRQIASLRIKDGFKRASTALRAARQTEAFKRAEKYSILYRRQRKQEVRIAAEHKVAFVMRTKGINCMAPKAKKVMQLLRL